MSLTDDELTDAARALHREWDSPDLWPRIATSLERDSDVGRIRSSITNGSASTFRSAVTWKLLATAATLVLAIGGLSWGVWQALTPAEQARATADPERLLNEQALADMERAEAAYIAAIEKLALTAAANAQARADESASPLVLNLRERLLAIDTAIADVRSEIDNNRFNAHMRRQLLWMYQEKRRTLEQILESDADAL
jgi:hypothetical protein